MLAKEMPDEELIHECKALWETINITECYSISDIRRLEIAMTELERRGYNIREIKEIEIEKDEEGNEENGKE